MIMDNMVDASIYCEVKIEPLEEEEEDIECVVIKQECFVDVELDVPVKQECPDGEYSGKLLEDIPETTEDIATRTFKEIRKTRHKNTNGIKSRTTKEKLKYQLTENDNSSDNTIELQHCQKKLSNEETKNKCDNQQKQFRKTSKRRKQSEKRFVCSTCDKSFNRNSSLIKHIRIHTGEKPFQCSVCQKCFSEKCNLEIHARIHTGVRPFHCTVCEKSFNQKVDLKRHSLIHSGAKPFQCNICRKCFNTKSNLDAHKRIHTGDKRYQCVVRAT